MCSNILIRVLASQEYLCCFAPKTLSVKVQACPDGEMSPQKQLLSKVLQNWPLCSGRLLSIAIWFCLSLTEYLPINFPSC